MYKQCHVDSGYSAYSFFYVTYLHIRSCIIFPLRLTSEHVYTLRILILYCFETQRTLVVMVSSGLLTVHDKLGLPVKALFSVEIENDELSLVVESRGGSSGSPNERNPQYNLGVDLILNRLAEYNCVLEDAVIDTKKTKRMGLSRNERRLATVGFPIDLSSVDLKSLRLKLCTAQRTIGQSSDVKGPGNNTKRMRLYVSGLPKSIDTVAPILTHNQINSKSDEEISPVTRPLRTGNKQGRGLSAKERKIVELHAMNLVRGYLSKHWQEVKDVSATHPCDFLCSSDGHKLYVEVKGTTGLGESVIITRNELALARTESPNTSLAVVSQIKLERGAGDPVASGGNLMVMSPWEIREDDLEPLAFDLNLEWSREKAVI